MVAEFKGENVHAKIIKLHVYTSNFYVAIVFAHVKNQQIFVADFKPSVHLYSATRNKNGVG